MKSGVVFEIREFALHDGPGIRTTVFLKGCPLRCSWCHNPEGWIREPQMMHGQAGDRLIGKEYRSTELARLLNQQAGILRANEGGVTFSGGEPLEQAEFVSEVCDQLDDLHVVFDTSGYGTEEAIRMVAEKVDLFYYDLKLMDSAAHRHFTGKDNSLILSNLGVLGALEASLVIRVPLVPGVTDTHENLSAVAEAARGLPGLLRVDLLPYNRAAGGKYRNLGLTFIPLYDEHGAVRLSIDVFRELGVPVRIAGSEVSVP
ncbi:MAG: 4Fe-4S cluster-binding domain-containing protein [Terriglobia bacterium]|jgi:pyruvate formate lyase activating enzyme